MAYRGQNTASKSGNYGNRKSGGQAKSDTAASQKSDSVRLFRMKENQYGPFLVIDDYVREKLQMLINSAEGSIVTVKPIVDSETGQTDHVFFLREGVLTGDVNAK